MSGGDDGLDRYQRQMLYHEVGEEGQRRLAASRVTLIGCGALGSSLADTLVRAGVGHLRICDRDFIELNNLQRQVLFDEQDIADQLPKAEAARRKLARINSSVTVEAVVADVNHANIERFVHGADLILDGTDNFETRYLINDAAVKLGLPWVYGGVIGATGLCMSILPGETPCIRCVFENAPPPELTPTCDTAGVLGPAVQIVTGVQSLEALKILMGRREAVSRKLLNIDAWTGRFVSLAVGDQPNPKCPCCGKGDYEFLRGEKTSTAVSLCGREAVQIHRGGSSAVDFDAVASKLQGVATGNVKANKFLVRAVVDGFEFTVFSDGRAIIKGTSDPDQARSLYARYIGG
jgi:adenylyltransferase/sulfurtransferase